MSLDIQTIEDLVDWGEPRRVQTAYGPRILYKGDPTQDFWSEWKVDKQGLKDAGISVRKVGDEWEVCWWKVPDDREMIDQDFEDQPKTVVEGVPLLTPLPRPDILISESTLLRLLPFQIDHVKLLIRSIQVNGAALDASDTGTGKTFTAIAVAKELQLKPIIICPKAIIPNWERVCDTFGVQDRVVVNYEKVKTGKTGLGSWNEKGDVWTWTLLGACILIFDECHRAKSRPSQNTKLLLASKRQEIQSLCLSATVATEALHMYALGWRLGLFTNLRNYWAWISGLGYEKDYWGNMVCKDSHKSMQRIHRDIFYNYKGSRMRISEIPDFPETLIFPEIIDFGNDIQKVYDQMQAELDRLAEMKENTSANILAQMTRARQEAELLKIPTLIVMTEDLIEEGNSVIIFVNFNESMDSLKEKLTCNCEIRGGQSIEQRQVCIDRFQRDEARIIVCNMQSGSVGLSLHDLNGNYPRVSLISPSFSAVMLKQCLGRIHRAGAKTKSIQKIVFAAGSIEENAAKAVEGKLKNLDLLNDGELTAGVRLSK